MLLLHSIPVFAFRIPLPTLKSSVSLLIPYPLSSLSPLPESLPAFCFFPYPSQTSILHLSYFYPAFSPPPQSLSTLPFHKSSKTSITPHPFPLPLISFLSASSSSSSPLSPSSLPLLHHPLPYSLPLSLSPSPPSPHTRPALVISGCPGREKGRHIEQETGFLLT